MSEVTESKIIENLRMLNRKERFILLKEALGKDTFQLSGCFRKKLKECLGLGFEIPDCAYVAMDYHIDWIQMAIYLANYDGDLGKIYSRDNIKGIAIGGINKSQRDVDLLVAFVKNAVTHLILVEAKADMPWDYGQLEGKVDQLKSICPIAQSLELHFVLISPNRVWEPKENLYKEEWPCWMKKADGSLNYLELKLDPDLRKITRWKMSEGEYKYYKIDHI